MIWVVIIFSLYAILGSIAAVYLVYYLISAAVKISKKDKF